MAKSALAANSMRLIMTSQGLRISDREMTQKSCPNGAPTLAAAACMAEIPGQTWIAIASHSGLALVSNTSNTAEAMA